ncbi:hypothetical protein HKX48_006559 [Thoreauomyces humboldtii]|nr:hypothetical protein HKX48_006559 [Thoreauomyces humboldtii]
MASNDAELQAPVVPEELDHFRQQWRSEVITRKASEAVPTSPPSANAAATASSPPPSTTVKAVPSNAISRHLSPKKSLKAVEAGVSTVPLVAQTDLETHSDEGVEAYMAATRHERMGNLSAALMLYQKAHKLNPNVEQDIRAQLRKQTIGTSSSSSSSVAPASDPDSKLYTYYDFPEVTDRNPDDTETLVQQFSKLEIGFEPLNPTRTLLPSEILSQIIAFAILQQGTSTVVNLSLVSKRMTVLCSEQRVWRTVCEKVHRPPSPDPLSVELPLYGDSWFDLWMDRPRVRCDGCFISRTNYLRQGVAVESYYAPTHLISYFRYLRFYPNGRVLFWTTTNEPVQAVKVMNADESSKLKGAMLGDYRLKGDQLNLDLGVQDRPGVRFKAVLKVGQSRRGRMNKLSWVAYWQEKRDSRSDIPLSTLRPFMFSKVNSYPRRLA